MDLFRFDRRSVGAVASGFVLWLACAPAPGLAMEDAVLEALSSAQIVILGEVHDNAQHHLNQARAIERIAPRAVVWEMLTPEQAARMPDDRQDADQVADALDWDGSGWPDFTDYYPIMMAAPTARHYGAGVPRDVARRVFDAPAVEVFAELFGARADPLGLETPLDAEAQATREAGQAAAHCDRLPADLLPGMVAAQRLRDAALAHVALNALVETGGPVAVIAGNGHARIDQGIPTYLARADTAPSVVSMGQLERAPDEPPPFDVWVETVAAERPDPCAEFQ